MDGSSSSSDDDEKPIKKGRFSVWNAKGKRRRKTDDDDWRRPLKEEGDEEDIGASQADMSIEEFMRLVDSRIPGQTIPQVLRHQPPAIQNITLKPYQLEGVNWLVHQHAIKVNCILGDEMGLGKTIQTISYLTYLKSLPETKNDKRPSLVICPLTLVQTWAEEFARCAPSLVYCKYVGAAEERSSIRTTAIQHAEDCSKRNEEISFLDCAVVITTPDVILMDDYFLSEFTWYIMVIDEAHRLKNPKSKFYKLLMTSFKKREHLVLLTGTPVQNNTGELWALLHFLAPDLFTDCKTFTDVWFPHSKLAPAKINVGSPQATATAKLLQDLLSRFLLRRCKATVLQDLPPKTEYLLYAPLSTMQRYFYKQILKKDIHSLFGGTKKALTNVVMQLRKCCNHPYLFEGAEPEPFVAGEHIITNSSKMVLIDKLLKELYDSGHKVLLFSQMTTMLDILQDYMDYRGYNYERLDGSVRGDDRYASVKRFQKNDETFVFLLSTRAGGLGLTLTAADTVVFVDSDWNPQVDIQAQERAHRIGQTRRVTIYRIICKETVEDIILKRALMKIKLTNAVLGADLDLQTEEATNLVDIIKFGAACILKDDEANDKPSSGVDGQFAPDPQYAAFLASSMVDLLKGREQVTYAQAVKTTGKGTESVYIYQGTDYKEVTEKQKAQDDIAALKQILAQSEEKTQDITLPQLARTRTAMKKVLSPEQQQALEEQRKQRLASFERQKTIADTPEGRREKEERRLSRLWKRWESAGYVSLALPLDDVVVPTGAESQPSNEEEEQDQAEADAMSDNLKHVVGDVTHPVTMDHATDRDVQIIVHCVNNSGQWAGGGVFRALDKLSKEIGEHYEAAKENQDLRLGDAHCVEVKDNLMVVSVVAQRSSTATSMSGGVLDMSLMEITLRRLQLLCQKLRHGIPLVSQPGSGGSYMRTSDGTDTNELSPGDTSQPPLGKKSPKRNVTLHFPHFGTTKEWYTVERLLKKYLRPWRTYVYYYPRSFHTVTSPGHATATPTKIAKRARSPDPSPQTTHSQSLTLSLSSPDTLDSLRFHLTPELTPQETTSAKRLIIIHGGIIASPSAAASSSSSSNLVPAMQDVVLVPDKSQPYTIPSTLTESDAFVVEDLGWLHSQTLG